VKRVVFDTNIVISGLLWTGRPYQVLQLARSGQVIAVTSEELIDELRDVLKRSKFQSALTRRNQSVDNLVSQYTAFAQLVQPVPLPASLVSDVEDVQVLEAALGGGAQVVVSGDDDLLRLKQVSGITVMTAQSFWALHAGQ